MYTDAAAKKILLYRRRSEQKANQLFQKQFLASWTPAGKKFKRRNTLPQLSYSDLVRRDDSHSVTKLGRYWERLVGILVKM